MNRLSSLLIIALGAFVAVSCMDEPEPPTPVTIDVNRVYTANAISTGSILMATREGWVGDTVLIRQYLNRLIAEEKDPGFRKKNASNLPLSPEQKLSFTNERALIQQDGVSNTYKYLLTTYGYNYLLRLTATDTLVYHDNDKPPAIDNLGVIPSPYYKEVVADAGTGYDYEIKTVPAHYAILAQKNDLYFMEMMYHLKAKNGWEGGGTMRNFRNVNVTQHLATGDTLLVQEYAIIFK